MELFCGPFCVVKFCVCGCAWMCGCVFVLVVFLLEYTTLGSAFKDSLFLDQLGEMIPFDKHIFQTDWNHQPVHLFCCFISMDLFRYIPFYGSSSPFENKGVSQWFTTWETKKKLIIFHFAAWFIDILIMDDYKPMQMGGIFPYTGACINPSSEWTNNHHYFY